MGLRNYSVFLFSCLVNCPGPSIESAQNTSLDAISSASVSTASSSGNEEQENFPPSLTGHQQGWERFDENEPAETDSSLGKPPLPPPRSEVASEALVVVTSTNPFAASGAVPSRPKSPFEDFSSSIAEALISNSEQKQAKDPASASTLATAGRELFETIQDEKSVEESLESQLSPTVAPILQPSVPTVSTSRVSALSQCSAPPGLLLNPVSSGLATSEVITAQLRTNAHPHQRSHTVIRQQNVLRPIPQEGTFSPDSIANNTNPFYSGSINAGNYPQLTPLSQKPCGPRSPSYVQNFPLPGSSRGSSLNDGHINHGRSSHPPKKPQPYSGECQWSKQNDQESSSVTMRNRQNSVPFMVQRLPSLGNFDPFGDFLSTDAGYVFENNNTSPL
jgi:hypothetical protein